MVRHPLFHVLFLLRWRFKIPDQFWNGSSHTTAGWSDNVIQYVYNLHSLQPQCSTSSVRASAK